MTKLVECNRCVTDLMLLFKRDIKDLRSGRYDRVVITNTLKSEHLSILVSTLQYLEDQDQPGFQIKAYLGPRLAELQSLATENGHLLRSVFNGLESARQRIAQLRHAQAHLGVYGRQGQAVQMVEGAESQEQKF